MVLEVKGCKEKKSARDTKGYLANWPVVSSGGCGSGDRPELAFYYKCAGYTPNMPLVYTNSSTTSNSLATRFDEYCV